MLFSALLLGCLCQMPLFTSCCQTKGKKMHLLLPVNEWRHNVVPRQILFSLIHLRGESCHYFVSSAHKVHNMSLLKRFDTHSSPMGCVTGKPPTKSTYWIPQPFAGPWGWKANHVFVYLICISIAVLSSEWFVFKHEVGLCKPIDFLRHTSTDADKSTMIRTPFSDSLSKVLLYFYSLVSFFFFNSYLIHATVDS